MMWWPGRGGAVQFLGFPPMASPAGVGVVSQKRLFKLGPPVMLDSGRAIPRTPWRMSRSAGSEVPLYH